MTAWPDIWPAEIERVLCAIPHPDDEVFCAALLRAGADAGAEVTITCATRGERGRLFGKEVGTDEIAAARTAELAESCRHLGAEPVFLDIADGSVGESPDDRRRLAAVIAERRPDLVVSYDADGGYGHSDHLAIHAMIGAVAAHASWRWLRIGFPAGLFAGFGAALRKARPALFPDEAVWLGRTLDEVDWILDLDERQRAVKRAVIASHASQLDHHGVFLFPELERSILAREWYLE